VQEKSRSMWLWPWKYKPKLQIQSLYSLMFVPAELTPLVKIRKGNYPNSEWTVIAPSNLICLYEHNRWRCYSLRAGLHYGGEVYRSWKKGRFSIVIGRKCNSWPVGVYTRWRKQWWWTFLMDDKIHGRPTWWHFLELGFSGLKRPDKKLLLWRSPTQ
jgi:hypothetical protein